MTITDLTEEAGAADPRAAKKAPFDVPVRTPAGFTHEFRVNENTKVQKLLDRAVQHFTNKGQLTGTNWKLVAVEHGHSRDLVTSARLGDAHVGPKSKLSLVTTDPQVDG